MAELILTTAVQYKCDVQDSEHVYKHNGYLIPPLHVQKQQKQRGQSTFVSAVCGIFALASCIFALRRPACMRYMLSIKVETSDSNIR